MDDLVPGGMDDILEVRAWKFCGAEKVLVAERVRDNNGRRRMIWHVEEAQLRGFLWLERLVEEDSLPSAIGIESHPVTQKPDWTCDHFKVTLGDEVRLVP